MFILIYEWNINNDFNIQPITHQPIGLTPLSTTSTTALLIIDRRLTWSAHQKQKETTIL